MMCCPFCHKAAHVRTSRYMSENVKERYHQCQNLECSATFKTHESIFEVIRSPVVDTKPEPLPTVPAAPRRVKGCYSSPFRH
ncbi:ogr/Delta-like zinc finger family protein [Tatumella ptyseos]|nr:ogr/Delta-like zinc finger family protein [Tatumella ptyseos]SQK76038.1 DNA-binding transcriptional regulator [Tatumella ptyseos]